MDNETEQLLTELVVVLPHFANALSEVEGDSLMTWVDRIEKVLKEKPND